MLVRPFHAVPAHHQHQSHPAACTPSRRVCHEGHPRGRPCKVRIVESGSPGMNCTHAWDMHTRLHMSGVRRDQWSHTSTAAAPTVAAAPQNRAILPAAVKTIARAVGFSLQQGGMSDLKTSWEQSNVVVCWFGLEPRPLVIVIIDDSGRAPQAA